MAAQRVDSERRGALLDERAPRRHGGRVIVDVLRPLNDEPRGLDPDLIRLPRPAHL